MTDIKDMIRKHDDWLSGKSNGKRFIIPAYQRNCDCAGRTSKMSAKELFDELDKQQRGVEASLGEDCSGNVVAISNTRGSSCKTTHSASTGKRTGSASRHIMASGASGSSICSFHMSGGYVETGK